MYKFIKKIHIDNLIIEGHLKSISPTVAVGKQHQGCRWQESQVARSLPLAFCYLFPPPPNLPPLPPTPLVPASPHTHTPPPLTPFASCPPMVSAPLPTLYLASCYLPPPLPCLLVPASVPFVYPASLPLAIYPQSWLGL